MEGKFTADMLCLRTPAFSACSAVSFRLSCPSPKAPLNTKWTCSSCVLWRDRQFIEIPSLLSFPSGPEEFTSQQSDSMSEDQKHVWPSHVSTCLCCLVFDGLWASQYLLSTYNLFLLCQGGWGELGSSHPRGHPGEVQRQWWHRPYRCWQELARGTLHPVTEHTLTMSHLCAVEWRSNLIFVLSTGLCLCEVSLCWALRESLQGTSWFLVWW